MRLRDLSLESAHTPQDRRAIEALIARLPKPRASRLAHTACSIGVFSIPVTAIAVLLTRAGKVELTPGLVAVTVGLCLAAIGVITGTMALIQIWRRGSYGAERGFIGVLSGLSVLAVPIISGGLALALPPIYDVTTDPLDPPAFQAAARRMPPENPAAYPGAAAAALQAEAYPAVEPLQLDLPQEDVYAAAGDVIAERGWTVLDAGRAPEEDTQSTLIQCSDKSLVLGFVDDIAIRIRPDGEGTRVDMRSASRMGAHDLGTNAARIESFLRDLKSKAGTRPASPE